MAVHVILHMMKFKAMLLTIVLFNQSPIVLSTRQRCQFSETLSQYSSLMSKSCTGTIHQEIKSTDTNGMIVCRCTTRSTQSLHSLSTLEAAFPKKLFHSQCERVFHAFWSRKLVRPQDDKTYRASVTFGPPPSGLPVDLPIVHVRNGTLSGISRRKGHQGQAAGP